MHGGGLPYRLPGRGVPHVEEAERATRGQHAAVMGEGQVVEQTVADHGHAVHHLETLCIQDHDQRRRGARDGDHAAVRADLHRLGGDERGGGLALHFHVAVSTTAR